MLCLVDTNILLRFADRSHPLYPVIRTAVKKLRQDGYKLQVVIRWVGAGFQYYWWVT